MSPDKRVYDVAKELNITTKELIEKLDSINIKIKSHSSTLTSFQIAKVKELYNAGGKDGDNKNSRPKAFVVKKVKKAPAGDDNTESKKDEEVKSKEVKPASPAAEDKTVEEKKEKPDIRELLLVREGIKKSTKIVNKKSSLDDKTKSADIKTEKEKEAIPIDENKSSLKRTSSFKQNKKELEALIDAKLRKEKGKGILNDENPKESENKNYIKPRDIKAEFDEKIKVKKMLLLPSYKINIEGRMLDGKKYRYKMVINKKVGGGHFPDQEENSLSLINILSSLS